MKNEPKEVCPKCSSTEVAGLVSAFWTSLAKPTRTWASESSISEKRQCGACQYEWDEGDELPPEDKQQ